MKRGCRFDDSTWVTTAGFRMKEDRAGRLPMLFGNEKYHYGYRIRTTSLTDDL